MDGQADRQTDGQTQGHSMYRTSIASRGKNEFMHFPILTWALQKCPVDYILRES